MIEATGLTKRYGEKVAVHDLSFTIRPCIVTGFLGSNGSGKPTTMRMIVGLDAPVEGRDGQRSRLRAARGTTARGWRCWRPARRIRAVRPEPSARDGRDHRDQPGAGRGSNRPGSIRRRLSNIAAAETGPPDPPRTRLRHTQAGFAVRPAARHRYQNGRRVACLL